MGVMPEAQERKLNISSVIAYVYWDEALSIGAVGKMGRDVFFASHFLALASFSPSPPAAQQIISSMKVIFGEDGTSRGAQNSDGFAKTTNFLWSEL
ncbi:hypothetical protein ACFX1Q_038510 [Malus domestica]